MPRVKVVLVTAPKGDGERLAREIVEQRLAACVNVVRGIKSYYWWEGSINLDDEDLLIIKTSEEKLDTLIKTVREIHPYSVPEILALDVSKGNESYIEWVVKEVGGG
ncbi:divalent-cation tolerance protein CutA [Aeropyrum camini]|uniref:CutA-like protein n=1 Tax=Aeropyrum camini SY1 = JCM 12091 TaxID=1198449 RepID=U3TGP7_9CREN|nr:divalent-cation tolerance protein CutA [Aeropyrum camini]BAN90514.1 CutA-like protein [Aeropyrum camini SY1 = JCM 12091]